MRPLVVALTLCVIGSLIVPPVPAANPCPVSGTTAVSNTINGYYLDPCNCKSGFWCGCKFNTDTSTAEVVKFFCNPAVGGPLNVWIGMTSAGVSYPTSLPSNTWQCPPSFVCNYSMNQVSICPRGNYCPTSESYIKCISGSYCMRGSLQPKSCPAASLPCPAGSSSFNSLPFLIAAIGIAMVFYAILVASDCWVMARSRKQSSIVQQQTELEQIEVLKVIRQSTNSDDNIFGAEQDNLAAKANTEISLFENNLSIAIDFSNISLYIPGVDKNVLNGVSGGIVAGKVTAIIGASGAGKTTLLHLLADKLDATTGSICINGLRDRLSNYRKIVGFVPQEDLVYPNLTVEENIMHHAQFRLASTLSKADITMIVDRTLRLLRIEGVRHSLVGDVEERGISGGQRKRVSIAMEMVSCPSLLFLDEPTSGLDSFSAEIVCRALQSVAKMGTTVALVVHQPRLELLDTFDRIIVLGVGSDGGRAVFAGPIDCLFLYLKSIGFVSPPNANPSDFVVDVAAGSVPRPGHPDFQADDLFLLWDHVVEQFNVEHEGFQSSNTYQENFDSWLRQLFCEKGMSKRPSTILRRFSQSPSSPCMIHPTVSKLMENAFSPSKSLLSLGCSLHEDGTMAITMDDRIGPPLSSHANAASGPSSFGRSGGPNSVGFSGTGGGHRASLAPLPKTQSASLIRRTYSTKAITELAQRPFSKHLEALEQVKLVEVEEEKKIKTSDRILNMVTSFFLFLMNGFMNICKNIYFGVKFGVCPDPSSKHRQTPGIFHQFYGCLLRSCKQRFHHPGNTGTIFAMEILAGCVLGLCFINRTLYSGVQSSIWNVIKGPATSGNWSTATAQQIFYYEFFSSMGGITVDLLPQVWQTISVGIVLVACTTGVTILSRDRPIFLRECAGGLSPSAYFWGKDIEALPWLCVSSLLFSALIQSFVPFQGDFWNFFAIVFAAHYGWAAVGMITSILFNRDVQSITAVVIGLIFATIFSGLAPSYGSLGSSAEWLWNMSFAYFAAEGFYENETAGYSPPYDPSVLNDPNCPLGTMSGVGFILGRWNIDLVACFLCGLGLRMLAWLLIISVDYRKQK